MDENIFGKRLFNALALRNIKPTELSEKTGISRGAISSYISGRWKAKQDNLFLIAKALCVNPGWLMGYDVPIDWTVSDCPENIHLVKPSPSLTKKDEKDIQKRLSDILNDMDSQDAIAMYNGGEPMDPETREYMKASLENALRFAKLKAKEKFTPKKYRKSKKE